MRLIDADYGQKQLTIAEVECGKNFETDCNHVRDFLNAMPTIDAVPVVRCEKCVLHGNCVTEDAFVLAGIENPFCCVGKRKEGADNG